VVYGYTGAEALQFFSLLSLPPSGFFLRELPFESFSLQELISPTFVRKKKQKDVGVIDHTNHKLSCSRLSRTKNILKLLVKLTHAQYPMLYKWFVPTVQNGSS